MTLATAMLFPTNFLQNRYLDLIEFEREAEIGKELPIKHTPNARIAENSTERKILPLGPYKESFQLAVRITSLAHTVLQFICAVIETLPVLLVTAVTVLFNATNSGFVTRNGGRLERIGIAAMYALANAWIPIVTSLWAVFDPTILSEEGSLALAPSAAYASLLSFTLPSLPKLANRLSPENRSYLLRTIREESTSKAKDVEMLELGDSEAFEWRYNLIDRLVEHVSDDAAYMYNDFDISSDQFLEDLQRAIRTALPTSSAYRPNNAFILAKVF